jgi:acetyl-CoA C-acetyltransferase
MMQRVAILGALRTAIGKFGGSLKDIPVADLGATVIGAVLRKSGLDPDVIDEVIMGNVLQGGQGQNPARQAALKAGLPVTVPAFTVNMVCGSGLNAVGLAADRIKSGSAGIVVAGGMENMSRAPFCTDNIRWGQKMGDIPMQDLILKDGLMDAFYHYHMGITAENIAAQYRISREEQDCFAAQSQSKAATALKTARFKAEITPVNVKNCHNEERVFDTDEFPRPDTTCATLSKLKPSFKKDGTVTAGNASGINDAAAALLIATEDQARAHTKKPLAYLKAVAMAGVDPRYMGLGPVTAVKKVLQISGLKLEEIGLFELNEAFAAQSIAVIRDLGLDSDKVNVNGGAIALGHPIGASGSRILVTLLYEMEKRQIRYGLASLCVGGGMGVAAIVERD